MQGRLQPLPDAVAPRTSPPSVLEPAFGLKQLYRLLHGPAGSGEAALGGYLALPGLHRLVKAGQGPVGQLLGYGLEPLADAFQLVQPDPLVMVAPRQDCTPGGRS